jgi:hypothetical protein
VRQVLESRPEVRVLPEVHVVCRRLLRMRRLTETRGNCIQEKPGNVGLRRVTASPPFLRGRKSALTLESGLKKPTSKSSDRQSSDLPLDLIFHLISKGSSIELNMQRRLTIYR